MTLEELARTSPDRRRFHESLNLAFDAEPLPLGLSTEAAERRLEHHVLRAMYADTRLHSGIPWEDGLNLYRVVCAERLERTLEIGLGFGFSALFCLQAHHERGSGRHTAIDPCQSENDPRTLEKSEWRGGALETIRAAGLSQHFEHCDAPDFLALPELIRQGRRFELCLLDAMGLFDLVVSSAVQADMLLDAGGLLVFRVYQPSIMKAVLFWLHNRDYSLLDVQPHGAQLVFLRKRADDARRCGFYHDF